MLNIINPTQKTLRISCPTKRKDGRFEIALNRTNNGDDEVIMQVNKDGTVEVRKCK